MRKLFQSEENSMEMSFNSRLLYCEMRMFTAVPQLSVLVNERILIYKYIRVLMLNKTLSIDSFHL